MIILRLAVLLLAFTAAAAYASPPAPPPDADSTFIEWADSAGKYLAATAKAVTASALALGAICALYWFVAILRGPVRVEVLEWSVPEEFSKAGVTSQSAARLIMDVARRAQRQGFQGYEPHIGFSFEKLPGDIDLEFLGVRVRFLQPILVSIGGRLVQVGGVISRRGNGVYALSAWGKTPFGTPKTVSREIAASNAGEVWEAAAQLVLMLVDPVALVLQARETGKPDRNQVLDILRECVRRDFPVRLGSATSLAELGDLTGNAEYCRRAIDKARIGGGWSVFDPLIWTERWVRLFWNRYLLRFLGQLGPLRIGDAERALTLTVEGNRAWLAGRNDQSRRDAAAREAEGRFRTAIYYDSSSAPALLALADLHGDTERASSADRYYRRANLLCPNSSSILCKWAENDLKLHDSTKKARDRYVSALAESPQNGTAYYNFGNLLFTEGLVEDSLVNYELAARYSPGLEVYRNWAMALLWLDRDDEAHAKLREALHLGTEGSDPHREITQLLVDF